MKTCWYALSFHFPFSFLIHFLTFSNFLIRQTSRLYPRFITYVLSISISVVGARPDISWHLKSSQVMISLLLLAHLWLEEQLYHMLGIISKLVDYQPFSSAVMKLVQKEKLIEVPWVRGWIWCQHYSISVNFAFLVGPLEVSFQVHSGCVVVRIGAVQKTWTLHNQ